MARDDPPARDDIARQLRHINGLLAEHPQVMDLLGGVVTELAVDGSAILLATYYPDQPQYGESPPWFAEIADLQPSVHVLLFGLAGPAFPCRSQGPRREIWRAGCWFPGGGSAGLDPVNIRIEFDADEATAAVINTALEDLIVMLQQRELARR